MAASTVDDQLTWQKVGENSAKSADPKPPTQPPIKCPECGSSRIWKDGLRYARSEAGAEIAIQRYICRNCGRRFSEDTAQGSYLRPNRHVFNLSSERSTCQVSVSEQEMKNLSHQRTRQKQVERGTTKPSPEEIKSILIQYSWYMKKQGYREASIISYTDRIKHLIRKGAILSDPEQVKRLISSVETWNEATRQCMADSYDVYVKMSGLEWEKPHYKRRESVPFIPTEKEIDRLIMGCGLKMRSFLQGLKDTGAGGGELHAIEWRDIDFERKKLAINHPTKGHSARILDVSDEWLRLVSRLPRTSERVWPCQYNSHSANFRNQRRRLAHEYDKPRLNRVSFRSLRHWKGTMEYHRTHDLKCVQRLLGHKTSQSTDIYVHIEEQLFTNLPKEYIVRRAVNVKGCMRLAAVGFEKFDEINGVHLYRKPRIGNEYRLSTENIGFERRISIQNQ